MMKTTNLEASKAIASLGIEVESEKWWWYDGIGWNIGSTVSMVIEEELETFEKYPAPNFQELILILPEIGEKLGWKELYNEEGWYEEIVDVTSHKLLNLLIANKGDMEEISQYIINLIKKKDGT